MIRRLAALAQTAPSACNRQASRLYAISDPAVIEAALKVQRGAGGFSDNIPTLLVVTVDRRMFVGGAGRNQRWIDGGIYAMNLAWAAQSLGLGSCFLNAMFRHKQANALRRIVGINKHEDIVVLMSIGQPAPGWRYAASPRLAVSSVLHERRAPDARQ